MTENLVSEQAWQWKTTFPAERFRAPVEMFWRGLGYTTNWQGEELQGERELDGQRRECSVHLRSIGPGVTEVRCRLVFVGTPSARRPHEVYRPTEVVTLLGQALARGFGAPASQI